MKNRKWSWKGFFFNGFYYAGKGNLKKGLILVSIAGLAAMGGIFSLLGLAVGIYAGLKSREELNLENKFNWKNVVIAVVIYMIVITLALMLRGMLLYGTTDINNIIENDEKANAAQIEEILEDKDISIVKNGIMDFNKATTLGEALDNWDNCENKKWDSFVTQNGQHVVEFSCDEKNAKEFFNELTTSLSQDDKAFAEYFDIDKSQIILQFLINRDSSFTVDYGAKKIIWSDGKSFENSKSPLDILKQAYNNEDTYDFSLLNDKISKGQLLLVLTRLLPSWKMQAK